MDEIFEKVKNIIADKLGVEPTSINEDSSFIDDLGADSLDVVDIVMAFEDEFGIKVEDEELEKFSTVKDVVEYIKGKM
ncbi:acyl carrier protein [Mesoaciditoga lauensis]|uniref:acyl carrier protein n=1 Tax=Mesoaciditoga lauensis TaxID=1495039 RepID=UPI0005641508|nr:acyl carrier protein [Mesoaciditoga lauensis]